MTLSGRSQESFIKRSIHRDNSTNRAGEDTRPGLNWGQPNTGIDTPPDNL
jgi:hypothetical protein